MESNQAIMNASFNLMRRLPQSQVQMNVAGLSQLINNEDLSDEIVQKIDQPLGNNTFGSNFIDLQRWSSTQSPTESS